MEYLILNEESIPFSSIADCKSYLPDFFKILSDALKHNMKSVRVTETFDVGWYNLNIADDFFVRDWISHQDKETKIRIKTIIDKTESPQIPANEIEADYNAQLSDFSLKHNRDIKTISLGAASLLGQIALSFQSKDYWNYSEIELLKIKLNNDGNIEEEACTVKNAAQFPHWEKHFTAIEAERKDSCKKGGVLWEQKELEFENLIFCKSTEKQFKQLSINSATFDKLWNNLKELNKFVCKCRNDDDLKVKANLNFSNESKSVENNPKLRKYRDIRLPDGSKKFFGLHIKNFPAALRLHFYPDYINQKIFIGYFGKHLPTKKN